MPIESGGEIVPVDTTRPYFPYIEKLSKLLEDGNSMAFSARECGVPRNTFESWRHRYPEFRELTDRAFIRGADVYVQAVRDALDGKHKTNPAYIAFGLKLRGLLIDKHDNGPDVNVDVKILNAGKDAIAEVMTKRTNRVAVSPKVKPIELPTEASPSE